MKVRLTKTKSISNDHNSTPVGIVIKGTTQDLPKKGTAFIVKMKDVLIEDEYVENIFVTTKVQRELSKNNLFYTKNSVYKLEIL